MSILESLLPVEESVGPLLLGAFATVNSLVADPVAVTFINSFPITSLIPVITLGEVKEIAFVASIISGLVPSLAVA